MAAEAFVGAVAGLAGGGYLGYQISNMMCAGRDHDADSAGTNLLNLSPIVIMPILCAWVGVNVATGHYTPGMP